MNEKTRKIGIAAAIGVAGVLAGGVLAGTLSASAESSAAPAATGYGVPANPDNPTGDPSKPLRSDEKLLTGTTKEKVTAAVTKKYPNATIQRVETDSDGVYEAHVVNGGTEMIVQVGKDFTITGTQTGGPGGHHGDGDGDGPGAAPQG
jgi:hypothetical protein